MTAETSNARGEWVLVPREPSAGMWDSAESAMIESECAYNAGDPTARSDAHGFPTMRIWQAVVGYRAMLAAAPPPPPPAAARGDVPYDRELIAQMLDAAEAPAFTMEEMDTQARLLREAAQAKPEARGVVDEDALRDARTIYDIACIRESRDNATREDVEFKAICLRNYNRIAALTGERNG